MTMAKGDKIDIWTLLGKRYPSTEYALLSEVRNAAGFNASRSADGIAMNLWPSRGLRINGIEIKAYRSDWLRELQKPAKAEAIFKYCDYWWLVATDETVVKIEEVPDTWGLLVAKGNRLVVAKDAPKLTPEPLTNNFVAAMLKRATQDMVAYSTITDRIAIARAEGAKSNDYEIKNLKSNCEALQKKIDDFEIASGVKMDRWSKTDKIGAAVRMVLENGTDRISTDLDLLKTKAETILNGINTALESLKKDKP